MQEKSRKFFVFISSSVCKYRITCTYPWALHQCDKSVMSPLFSNDDNIQHPHKLVIRRKWWVQSILPILLRLLPHCSGLWNCLRKGNYIARCRTGCSAKQKLKERKVFNNGQGTDCLPSLLCILSIASHFNRSTALLLCLAKIPRSGNFDSDFPVQEQSDSTG